MKTRTASPLFIILVGVMCFSLIGCAGRTTATAPAQTTPEMLKAAGFKQYVADTPEKMAHLQACPVDTLMIHERRGARCYAFAEPSSKTMYIGDEAAYQRLKGLMEARPQKVREQKMEEDPLFWNMWGSLHGLGG